jgi:hypothetical protein
MIQCDGCEFFQRGAAGQVGFRCDPFATVKEPECLIKWQLLRMSEVAQKVDRLVAAYEATLAIYKKLEPLQEKMFRHMEREIDDVEDADSWKYGEDEEKDDAHDEEEEEGKGGQGGPYTS